MSQNGQTHFKNLICLNPGIQDEKKWGVEPYLSWSMVRSKLLEGLMK